MKRGGSSITGGGSMKKVCVWWGAVAVKQPGALSSLKGSGITLMGYLQISTGSALGKSFMQ